MIACCLAVVLTLHDKRLVVVVAMVAVVVGVGVVVVVLPQGME